MILHEGKFPSGSLNMREPEGGNFKQFLSSFDEKNLFAVTFHDV